MLAVNIAVSVPFLVLNYPDNGAGLASLLALYAVAVHCGRREATVALGWTSAVMIPLLTAGVFYSGEQLPVATLVSNVVIFATAWLIGDGVRNRRILVEDLRFRAETAERQREDEARQAVLDERARIAREMHDIVAHGMSVMIVQAGAARRVLAKHPDQAVEAMAVIEQTGRDAMVEMRRLLGVLRDESADAEPPSVPTEAVGATTPVTAIAGRPEAGPRPEVASRAPQPGMQAVPALVQQWTTAGLEATYEVVGDLPPLSTGLDVSAYRLIQEALTNASKHAGPAQVRVTVLVTDAGLDITVVDDGYGAAAVPVPGRGLFDDPLRRR